MTEQAKIQEIVRFIASRRVGWRISIEDNVMKIITGSSSVEWSIFTELAEKFPVTIRDAICVNNTLFVSLIVNEGK